MRRSDNPKDPLAILREFTADVEAVGIKSVARDWPDLAITYRKAKAAVDSRPVWAALLKAADDLLVNARDTGECFLDEDHEDCDPKNPEKMYDDWEALDFAVEQARAAFEPEATQG